MKFFPITPKKALIPFPKQKPQRIEIDNFKIHLIALLDKIEVINLRPKEEREEHLKNDVRDFLRDTYYRDKNAINTKENKDLVIHLGKKTSSNAGVIIEAKRPTNLTEMISVDNVNKKALHELILYYLDERFVSKNNELKQLIITNIYDWFIIDANQFDKHIYGNPSIRKLYELKINDKKLNPFFYDELSKIIEKIDVTIPCVHFNIMSYDVILRNNNKKDDKELSALLKILSPQYLLKQEVPNDSNSLDEGFYRELLHIIGLEEATVEGKKIIRLKLNDKSPASLIEITLRKLRAKGTRKIQDLNPYGKEIEEQYFNIALELCITWVNRVLFLKLLEGQLKNYHSDDKYLFLNKNFIQDFDELFTLFHEVLSVDIANRDLKLQKKYNNVPYLNSSLFEISPLEDLTFCIDSLDNTELLHLADNTVLKDVRKKTDKLTSLEYLLKFLDSYDFASEGNEDVQEDNKDIINASVLGKVFEKINGYKDGSIFTPAFITMFMCKQVIQLAVVDKFNENYIDSGISFEKFDDVKNFCLKIYKTQEILHANEIINSLKICDPAVGSGHFLVSSLNEIISIKAELQILADEEGKSLGGFIISVVGDELRITDHQLNIVEYKIRENRPLNKDVQRLQEVLFREKQLIIENCLFGVDINPNSVKICRLRLWIELLKNAYYKESSGFTELETLPNIDINIKCGNSLISNFDIKNEIFDSVPNYKKKINDYKYWVKAYKNAKDKNQKHELSEKISLFNREFRKQDPKIVKLQRELDKQNNEFYNKYLSQKLFSNLSTENILIQKQKDEVEISKTVKRIDEIKNDISYKNSFEWRFEFPEVLNNDGDYLGFDVIIGNPPYMRIQEIERTQPSQKLIYEKTYSVAKGSFDLANLFFELAVKISKVKSKNGYIFPHKFLNADSSEAFRKYLTDGKFIDKIAHFGANMVFDNADTYTCIAFFSKEKNKGIEFQKFKFKSDYLLLINDSSKYKFLSYQSIKKASSLYGSNNWILFDDENGFEIFEKIYKQKSSINQKFEGIYQGIATSKDKIYVLNVLERKENTYVVEVPFDNRVFEVETELFKPFLMGKEVQRYSSLTPNKVCFFPYDVNNNSQAYEISEVEVRFPLTFEYIRSYEREFRKREGGKGNTLKCFYAYIYPKNLNKFEQPKLTSMEICSVHPNVTLNFQNLYHTTKAYSWVKKEDTKESYKYFLAIANSKLIWWFLKNTGDTLQGDARTFKTNYLNPFPLPDYIAPNLENEIIAQVDIIIHQKINNINTDNTEKKINTLIYGLYKLSPEQIEIVESV